MYLLKYSPFKTKMHVCFKHRNILFGGKNVDLINEIRFSPGQSIIFTDFERFKRVPHVFIRVFNPFPMRLLRAII
jgi:hypothetical protein